MAGCRSWAVSSAPAISRASRTASAVAIGPFSAATARFALASCGVLRFQALDGDDAIESRVAGLPDLTHPAAPEQREDS